MKSLHEDMAEFRKQLQQGSVQKAYQGLLEFMTSLKHHFAATHPDYAAPGGLYQGYMDMTYFALLPGSLQERELKIAVVFLYDSFRFEIWLSGKNKRILNRYWKLIRDSGWHTYKVVEPGTGVDAVVEHVLAENPDFSDLNRLTKQIEQEAVNFISEIESLLTRCASRPLVV